MRTNAGSKQTESKGKSTPVSWLEYTRKVKIEVTDFVFARYEDFIGCRALTLRPIQGKTTVAIVDPELSCVESFKTYTVAPWLELIIYARKERLKTAGILNTDVDVSYDTFLQHSVATLPCLIEPKAAKALFYRTRGDSELLDKCLEELRTMKGTVTAKQIDKMLPTEDTVYAIDVVGAMFCYGNDTIPRKGAYLSRYKYKAPFEVLHKYENTLGAEIAFFAIRKAFRELYAIKSLALQGKESKKEVKRTQGELLRVIDYYTLAHAVILFNSTIPESLYAIMQDILARFKGQGSCLFQEVLYADIH